MTLETSILGNLGDPNPCLSGDSTWPRTSEAWFSEVIEACHLRANWTLPGTTLVTVRTPATMAVYHRFENRLFDRLLDALNLAKDVTTVVLPRTSDQAAAIQSTYPNLRIPTFPLDGRDLVSHSDLVVSAGGTMNREAAILGTPVWTVFAGSLPAVDRKLVEMNRMQVLRSEEDIRDLRFVKKQHLRVLRNERLCSEICAEILRTALR